jgi:hypothetical protein
LQRAEQFSLRKELFPVSTGFAPERRHSSDVRRQFGVQPVFLGQLRAGGLTHPLERVSDGVDRLATIDVKNAIAPGGATLLPFVPAAFLPSPVDEMATGPKESLC